VRVLFLTHNFPRTQSDASGSFLLRLAVALRKESVDVRVVAPASPGAADHDEVDGIPVDRFHYAPRRFETLAYGGNMASQVRESWRAKVTMVGFLGSEFTCAIRARRQFDPDIIHAHWWFPNGLAGTWMSRLANRPLVTTLHGTDVRLARAVAFARPGFRHVLQHSTIVTAVSNWLATEANQLVSQPCPIVAPMPVATELFSPDGVPRTNRLLFVGRLNRQKGIEMLLDAVARSTSGASLDVIGDGDDRQRLEQRAAALGISQRVRWLGALPQPQLAHYYRCAAALVVPSVDEGLGLVAVEAQLCETPVVAFASGGLTDVIQHDRTGLLVGDLTADALAAAIDSLLARSDRGASLGAAGRLHALATFAPQSVARRYAGLYNDAAKTFKK
jgi:glycosyltransferase involved in cell wall biosynthesis